MKNPNRKFKSHRHNIFKKRPDVACFNFTKVCTGACGLPKPFEYFNYARTNHWVITSSDRCNACKKKRYTSQLLFTRNLYHAAVTKLAYAQLVEERNLRTTELYRRDKVTHYWDKLSKSYIRRNPDAPDDPDILIYLLMIEDIEAEIHNQWIKS